MSKFDQYYNTREQFVPAAMFFQMHRVQPNLKEANYEPWLTFKPVPHDGLESAYQIYMNSTDEYDAALKLCPTFADWERICNVKWFREPHPEYSHLGIEVWRDHMRTRDASLAKAKLIEATKNDNITAAKALLAESKEKKSAGRTSKKKAPTKLAIVKEFEKKREARKS